MPRLSVRGFFAALGACLSLSACATPAAQPAAPPPPPPVPADHVPPPVSEPDEPKEHSTPTLLSNRGFATPESVYFDKKRDVYFVSNLNGGSHEKNGKGFISRITPGDADEYKVDTKFIDGEKEGFTLHSPKGLTIVEDTLYVADIDTIRLFDAQSGEKRGEITIKGATLLNGLATGEDNVVYVSDTGVTPQWKTNGSDALYIIKQGAVTKLIAHPQDLKDPNGLLAGKGGVWVTTGSGEIYWISNEGKLSHRQQMSKGGNDGFTLSRDGRALVSSWADKTVYVGTFQEDGKLREDFRAEITQVESPADIGFDCTRNQVLIPLFNKNEVAIYPMTLSIP